MSYGGKIILHIAGLKNDHSFPLHLALVPGAFVNFTCFPEIPGPSAARFLIMNFADIDYVIVFIVLGLKV